MLDQQRKRSSNENRSNTALTRAVVLGHLFLGVASCGTLVFHEQFKAATIGGAWLTVSVVLVLGLCARRQWCRVLLGIWFWIGAVTAMLYLAWLPAPESLEGQMGPPLALRALPFWLSAVATAYLAAGLVVLMSRRISTAVDRGFSLWDIHHNW